MTSDKWECFHVLDTVGSTIGSKKTFFVAYDPKLVTDRPENPDHDTVEDMKWVTLPELWKMLDNNEIEWSDRTIAGIQILRKIS